MTLTSKNYKCEVTRNGIQLQEMFVAPALVEKLTEILDMAGKMSHLKVLPSSIVVLPFSIEFNDDGSFTLRQRDYQEFIKSNFSEIDELIDIAQKAHTASQEMNRLTQVGGTPPPLSSTTPDVFEGRN